MPEARRFVNGRCWNCGRSTTFDPTRVPSVSLDAASGGMIRVERLEPICLGCVRIANVNRRTRGLPIWSEDPAAYCAPEGPPE